MKRAIVGRLARSGAAMLAVAGLTTACGNPVVDARIAALGPEEEGVPPGPTHRPGQPCVLCHSEYVGAEPLFTVAGTIYAYPFDGNDPNAEPIPVEGVTIDLADSFGNSPAEAPVTNCAGNFYLTRQEYNPAFPLRVEIRYPVDGIPEGKRVPMSTRISRDGSCAGCHAGAPNQGSPGWVYVVQKGPGAPVFTKPDPCPNGGEEP